MVEIISAIKLLYEIIMAGKSLMAFIDKNKEEQWFKDSAVAFGNLQQKTPEERQKLAKDIGNLIRNM